MRFLLKPSSPIVASRSQAKRMGAPSKAIAASPPATSVEGYADGSASGKAWGQQCSPECGCVLRIEAQLSECPSKASPTIVQASYHAKRVMATVHKGNSDVMQLKPLTTQHKSSRPILTSCTCPTLHHLAQRTVDHLPGKTLAQMRNEIDMGLVGARSSAAFRHTVLREIVLPAIVSTDQKQLGLADKQSVRELRTHANSDGEVDGAQEMNSTQIHGRCYDLVEDSILSMIHERMPEPRRDNHAEAYSPTIGRYFRMYSPSRRNRQIDDTGREQDASDDSVRHSGSELSSFHDVGDWQRKSPSSFFLFGDDLSNDANTNDESLTGLFFRQVKESIRDRFSGGDTAGLREPSAPRDASDEDRDRSAYTYLQLLDMYGASDDSGKETKEEPAMDDWLLYVDQMHSGDDRSSTAG